MTFTAIFPDAGRTNGRLTVRSRCQLHATASISARSARLRFSYGSSAQSARLMAGWDSNPLDDKQDFGMSAAFIPPDRPYLVASR